MIVVNGMEYRTHQQNLYANGKKVLAAYCNGNLVYPEREDTTLLKVIGHINTIYHIFNTDFFSIRPNTFLPIFFSFSPIHYRHSC